jgi:hypothetical protein
MFATALGCNAAEANEIRDEIRGDDYRSRYARAPGWAEPRQPSQGGPHGDFVDIYVNEVMSEASADAEESGESLTQWPEGSIIVKDTWKSATGNDVEYLAFMERRSDGWFWAEYRRGKRLVSSGVNDSTCAGCHSSGNDQVRAFELP